MKFMIMIKKRTLLMAIIILCGIGLTAVIVVVRRDQGPTESFVEYDFDIAEKLMRAEDFARDGDYEAAKGHVAGLSSSPEFGELDSKTQAQVLSTQAAYASNTSFEEAVTIMNQAVSVDSSSPRLYMLLGEYQYYMGDHENALNSYQLALSVFSARDKSNYIGPTKQEIDSKLDWIKNVE